MSVYMYRRNVSTNLNVRKCAYIYIYIYCRVCLHMIYSYIEREIGFNVLIAQLIIAILI